MVTLQGEKKGWNGTKPWCLNDLVSSFNPCAPYSLGSLCVFPCFLSSSSGLNYPLMIGFLWNEQMSFYMACYVWTRLPSRNARHGE